MYAVYSYILLRRKWRWRYLYLICFYTVYYIAYGIPVLYILKLCIPMRVVHSVVYLQSFPNLKLQINLLRIFNSTIIIRTERWRWPGSELTFFFFSFCCFFLFAAVIELTSQQLYKNLLAVSLGHAADKCWLHIPHFFSLRVSINFCRAAGYYLKCTTITCDIRGTHIPCN